jgi:hypothetical protein
LFVNGDDSGLFENDAVTLPINKKIASSEVDSEFGG